MVKAGGGTLAAPSLLRGGRYNLISLRAGGHRLTGRGGEGTLAVVALVASFISPAGHSPGSDGKCSQAKRLKHGRTLIPA